MDRSITLHGLGAGAVVDCSGNGSAFKIEGADSVVIKNMHVRNATSADNEAGLCLVCSPKNKYCLDA